MNIVKNSKIFFSISLVIIVIGIITGLTSGFNYGIDFTGGTLLQIDMGKTVPVNEIREITDEFDKDASIIHAGEEKNEVIIKSKLDMDNTMRKEIVDKFLKKYDLEEDAFIKAEKISPSIGNEIRRKAVISIAIATIGMLIYITFRFEFKFALSAIIALLHDVLIAIAFYAIFKFQINSSFVAAILTIVGYSINDTIVVFDRIRENIKLMRKDKYEDIVNKSIAQTITRSINTSVTTLMAIGALYIFGVEAIRDFALPLIVGVVVGTYSSIFIASPLWLLFKTRGSKNGKYNARRV